MRDDEKRKKKLMIMAGKGCISKERQTRVECLNVGLQRAIKPLTAGEKRPKLQVKERKRSRKAMLVC